MILNCNTFILPPYPSILSYVVLFIKRSLLFLFYIFLFLTFEGGGCGVGLGLGWGFGTGFGSKYRSSRVVFQGVDFNKKSETKGRFGIKRVKSKGLNFKANTSNGLLGPNCSRHYVIVLPKDPLSKHIPRSHNLAQIGEIIIVIVKAHKPFSEPRCNTHRHRHCQGAQAVPGA
ncbi:hypothetical protein R6Q59_035793 [Mikania micrantha]